ncbi:MAG TPA: alpha/beta hydrolase [Trueperaceae bacterium]
MAGVEVDGVRIAYHEAGAGEPLVCIHGNFASGRWFTEVLRAPPAGWRVLAPDLPNFGASGRLPGPISIDAYAGALAGFIGALGLERPVLLGHSLGGAVAQASAAHVDPRGMVLLSSPGPWSFPTAEEHYAVLQSLAGNAGLMAQALAPTMPTCRPAIFDELVADALRMAPDAFSGNARALERHAVPGAARLGCPVLVMQGEHDFLVSRELAERTAGAYPGARLLLLDGVGHSPQLEAPARFRAVLQDFLEGLP